MHTQSHTTRLFRLLGVLFSLFGPIGSAAAQDKPIRIGEINSYSGVATVFTFPYKQGLAMATKEINDAGGVLGRPRERHRPRQGHRRVERGIRDGVPVGHGHHAWL